MVEQNIGRKAINLIPCYCKSENRIWVDKCWFYWANPRFIVFIYLS